MKAVMPKAYEPKDYEKKIYTQWENSGFFNPDNLKVPKNAKPYTIILPPPNITAKLHLGHGVMLAIEDLLIRFHRLNGFKTLWLPGTDHAAIATQNVVEKKLLKEQGKTRQDLGKEKFLKEVWSFLRETRSTIQSQFRKMGSSLDWSREAFTLDDKRKKAVTEMFVQMYENGLIYRGERIVNWCPRCHSTLADDEVEYREEKGQLFWLKYGPFVLATSRPETKLGDTAVAVYPGDKRYQEMVGKKFTIKGVLGDFEIKVVADRAVDPKFGSGAIKVTPAHDFTDNEIALRHGLPMKQIIDENGKMMENCGKYAGLTTSQARTAIVKDMEKLGLIDHIEEGYLHNVGTCYRCGSVIEPIPSKQWFVSVDKKIKRLGGKSLKEKALEVSKKRKLLFYPKRFTKRYEDWIKNLHDWCISRQIWFGHEIPAWFCADCQKITVSRKVPRNCLHCQSKNIKQDTDTLDTWFSSGMWTFSTLGWPDNFKNGKKTGDLKTFHPTQVLNTGYEIITLWVSRMIMMSLFAIGEIPFENVYLHGLVLDINGKKMSKSKGNGLDPQSIIEKYGADAARLSLLIGATPGNDTRLSEEKIQGLRNLINKLWNVARFIQQNKVKKLISIKKSDLTVADQWILSKMKELIETVSQNIKEYKFSPAAEALRDFTWNELADWYLEISKIESNRKTKQTILQLIIRDLMKLWHPFIPFLTEAIWAELGEKSLLMVDKWPQTKNYQKLFKNQKKIATDFELLKKIITSIRNLRNQYNLSLKTKINVFIQAGNNTLKLKKERLLISNMGTAVDHLEIKNKIAPIFHAAKITLGKINIQIPLEGVIDIEKESKKMREELIASNNFLEKIKKQLENKNFLANAPKEIIEKEKEKMKNLKNKIKELKKYLIDIE